MVSQLPSFMIAVAAGLVTTRVTASNASGLDLGGQILADLRQHPVALILVGTFCLGLAPLAGIPAVPFIALGAVAVAAGTAIRRTERRSRISPVGFRHPMPSFTAPGAAAPPVFIDEQQPPFDAPIVVLLSRELAERIDAVRLDSLVAAAADRLAQAWGAPYPGLRCGLLRADTAAAEPPPLQLRWLLNGTEVCRLAWRDDQQLRLGLPEPHADGPLKLLGFPDAEWIAPDGQAAPDLLEQLVAGVTEHLCLREPARTLTHEQFHVLMTSLKRDYPQLAEGLAATIPLPVLTDVARCLLREGLSLRSLPPMCDLLLSQSPLPQDANSIAEVVVTGWSRRRCADAAPDGTLRAHLVDPLIEDVMQGYAAAARDGTAPGSSVPDADAFREVRQLMSDMAARHPRGRINLLCRGPARVLVSEIAAMASSRFRVFSFRGVNPRFDIEILSRLTLSAASAERLAADRQNWDEPIARPAFQDNFGDGADGGTGFPDDFAPDEHQPGFMQ